MKSPWPQRSGGIHPVRRVLHVQPVPADASERLSRALDDMKLKGICLFPAMHRYRLDDERVEHAFESTAKHKAVVFAHCGVLSVGVRKKLSGLPSPFDLRLGDPLTLSTIASAFPARYRSSSLLRRGLLP